MIRLIGPAFAFALGAWLTSMQPAAAQLAQQGAKIVGTGFVGIAQQGYAAAMSADGNTAIVGGPSDNSNKGAAWIYTRSNGVWSQQGNKLVGIGAAGNAAQGSSVALSADGNTAVVSGHMDNSSVGAAWVFVRSGGVWNQQGNKLIATGTTGFFSYGLSISGDGNTILAGAPLDGDVGAAYIFTRSGNTWSQLGSRLVGTGSVGSTINQGTAVSLSADGNTALVTGNQDNSGTGASWVFIKSNGAWVQQGAKLVGMGFVGVTLQGTSASLSADGNTAAVGGYSDNSSAGASWIFTRAGGVWSQQGPKLVGTGAAGTANQGRSVSLSSDGNNLIVGGVNDGANIGASWVFARTGTAWAQVGTKLVGTGNSGGSSQGRSVAFSGDAGTALVGGFNDSSLLGAAWFFTQPAMTLAPTSPIAAAGNVGGPFSPPSFDYVLKAINADITYSVAGIPLWLTASSTSGTITAGSSRTVTFTVNGNANAMASGAVGPTAITIANVTNAVGTASISAALTVSEPGPVTIVSSVLPSSRSVQVGSPATAFSTLINTSSTVATNCGLGLGSSNPASFSYQTTDSATNAPSGTPNTPVNVPPNGVQSFVFAITPSAAFGPTEVPITAGCSNSSAAPSVVGLNTLLLSASTSPVPDIVALGATASNDGIVNIPGAYGTGAFAVATVNVGTTGAITVSADTGAASLPLSINLCQTNPASGQCTSVMAPTTTTSIASNATPTFAIFVQGAASVPFDPANNRVFVRFKDAGGVVRGATSVAVRTQ